MYFSMHKFVGGVQTPGVLIAKKILFKAGERHPDGCGGGSVCFVRRNHQVYLKVNLILWILFWESVFAAFPTVVPAFDWAKPCI